MKKFMFVSMMVFVLFMVACAQQQIVSSADGQPVKEKRRVHGSVATTPCFVPDADTDFLACTGVIETTPAMEGDAYDMALQLAQDMCAKKLEHTVEGLAKSYRNRYGANQGNDLAAKMENGFNHIIREKMKQTKQSCQLHEEFIDESTGRFKVYVGIKISRSEVADALVKDMVDQEKKDELDYRAHEFGKEIRQAIKDAKTEDAQKQQEYIDRNTKVLDKKEGE